MMLLNMA